MTPSQTPRQKALAWWQTHVDQDRYVVKASDGPDSSATRYLLEEGHVVEVAGGRVWILAVSGREDAQSLCLTHYWPIVRVVIDDYNPAVIEGGSAVRVHLEDPTPPPVLTVRHAKNQSKYDIQICTDQLLRLTPGPVDQGDLMLQTLGGADLPTESPEHTLFRLPLSVLEDHLEDVTVWLRSLVISPRELRSAYQKNPRPVVAKRMAHLAEDVGNDRLAQQIDDLLIAEYGQRITRERTGVGSRIVVPNHVTEAPRAQAPWLDRHGSTFARMRRVLKEALEKREDELPRFPLEQLKEQARAAKSYDAYHSTTIEGYRISPEEASAVLRNEPVAGQDPEEVRSRMAIAGYGAAFERCLEVAQDQKGPIRFSEALISDLYVDLFSPSVEAGIITAENLRGYRSNRAYLRGHPHIPPSPRKVPALMTQFIENINQVSGAPLIRATLAHLDFVTIHPFPDGNGRIARFLMNLALLGEGLPWVTIRNDDRPEYFNSLEKAQVEGDFQPFGSLVAGYVEAATKELT